MNSKMTQLATLFAAGSFLAAAAAPLGASPVSTTIGTPSAMEAFGSGSCGGKDAKDDKKADDTKKASKDKKEGSCGAGSCGGKADAKKDTKKAKKDKKEGSCGAGSCGGKEKKAEKKAEPTEKK